MNNPIIQVGYKLLEHQIVYDSYQTCVGSVSYRRRLVKGIVGRYESFLDIGCGTASTVDLLPSTSDYLGIDISQKYLEKARSRRPGIKVIHGDISSNEWLSSINLTAATMCIALGIYHHLDDLQLNLMLDNCVSILPRGSQLFSMDPVITATTNKVAIWFAENDRGKFVRTPQKLEPFFTSRGLKVEMLIKTNEMTIPLDTLEVTATII